MTKEDVTWNKKSHIKMFKTALFDCAINEKCCSVDGGRGICPLFSSPPRGIWQIKSPYPREFAIQGQKNANARGSAREWGGGGRGWLDWCIIFFTESRDPFEKVSQHLKFFIVNESISYGLKIRSCIVLKDAIAKKLCYERKSEFYICVFMSVSSSTYPPTAS